MKKTKSHNGLKNNLCVLCHIYPSEQLCCEFCLQDIPWLTDACTCCGMPKTTANSPLCGQCIKQPPTFDQTFAACHYQFPLNSLISQAKNHQKLHFLSLLVQFFCHRFKQIDPKPELLIPVPSHWKSIQKRGFNHARLLAEKLGQFYDIPVAQEAVKKIHYYQPQKELNREQRLKSLYGSFILTKPIPKHIAVVDDVMTTGATLSEMARLLKYHQAEQVDAWVIARTPY